MKSVTLFEGFIRLNVAVLVASLFLIAPSSAATTWSWRASGTLGAHQNCSKHGTSLSKLVCGFHVANAPRVNVKETAVVRFTNTTTRTKCFALSISSTYMAGLRDVCVKPKTTGHIAMSGPARQYRSTQLSIFVASGSASKPIAPLRDSATSPFTVVFSQPLA